MRNNTSVSGRNLEARYEKYKSVIRNFTLMNDILMRNVFKQRECLEYVLQIIMERQDLPIYHINRKIEEVGKKFPDEAYIIYVNSGKQDDTELGKLMHDLHCKNADEMYSPVLAK